MGNKKKDRCPKGGEARDRFKSQLGKQLEAVVQSGKLPSVDPQAVTRTFGRKKEHTVPSEVFQASFSLAAILAGLEPQQRCFVLDGMAGRANGHCCVSLGWMPGTSVLVKFRSGQMQIIEATPDVKEWLTVPSEWMEPRNIPEKLADSFGRWLALVEGLGGKEPSPWNSDLATQVLSAERGEDLPDEEVVLGTTKFVFRGQEVPLGVVLRSDKELEAMVVEGLYNPGNLPGTPSQGTAVSTVILQRGEGPVQKLLRFWANLLETNFNRRYTKRGVKRNR